MPVSILALLTALALAACSGRDTPENRVFSPTDVEFSVTFPGPPKLSQVTGQGGWFSKPTTLSVATRGNNTQYLRADTVAVDVGSLGELSRERLINYGLSYAENQGFESVEVTAEQKSFGPCYTVRGRKKIESLPYLFLHRTCFGKRSMITQYVVSPPQAFPPDGGTQFLASLEVR